MALGSLVKTLQNIMRNDAGINGDAQRIEQMTWLFFLKIYDAKEEEWEFHDDSYESIIPDRLRWHSWAPDAKDGSALTGDELLDFVNNDLFKTLADLELDQNAPLRQVVVKAAFTDTNNYMKDGILLRQVVNAIDESVDFTEYKERHAFGEIYETILKDLQSAGNAGEFYTPRAVTDFMAEMLAPKLGESVADFACGTGGFLTSALKLLAKQVNTPSDQELYSKSIYGIEKKQLPYLLCITNMLLHDIDNPQVFHDNSLEHDVRDYRHKEGGQFDVVLMNPPIRRRREGFDTEQLPDRLAQLRDGRPVPGADPVPSQEEWPSCGYHSRRIPLWPRCRESRDQAPPAGGNEPAYGHSHAPECIRSLHAYYHQHPVLRQCG